MSSVNRTRSNPSAYIRINRSVSSCKLVGYVVGTFVKAKALTLLNNK